MNINTGASRRIRAIVVLQDLMKRGVCRCGVEMLLVRHLHPQPANIFGPLKGYTTSTIRCKHSFIGTQTRKSGEYNVREYLAM